MSDERGRSYRGEGEEEGEVGGRGKERFGMRVREMARERKSWEGECDGEGGKERK